MPPCRQLRTRQKQICRHGGCALSDWQQCHGFHQSTKASNVCFGVWNRRNKLDTSWSWHFYCNAFASSFLSKVIRFPSVPHRARPFPPVLRCAFASRLRNDDPAQISFNARPHLIPLPQERTYRRRFFDFGNTVLPIPSHDIPQTRRTSLLSAVKRGRGRVRWRSFYKTQIPSPCPSLGGERGIFSCVSVHPCFMCVLSVAKNFGVARGNDFH